MNEILNLRQENSKTFSTDKGRQLVVSMGAVHYKDNYSDAKEPWKDIDLTWEGNKITKAPYELTLDGLRATIRNKKTGEIVTIELSNIGLVEAKPLPWTFSRGIAGIKDFAKDTDLEIVAENSRVRFTRILKSAKAPTDAQFRVTDAFVGFRNSEDTTPFRVRACDEEGELQVETSLVNEKLTEELIPENQNRPIKYPVRIDPTWQVGESTDDCYRSLAPTGWDVGGAQINVLAGAELDASTYQFGCGMRFTNVTIPQGATITNACLTFRCSVAKSGDTCNTRISAEDVDDAVTFADDKDVFDARWAARTTARVDWDAIAGWTKDVDYNSPECKTIEQELIDRPTWASGNDQVWFWEDFEDRSTHASGARRLAYSYDGSTTYCPQLVITYALPITISSAGAIASAEALGSPQANLRLALTGIESGEAIGTVLVIPEQFISPDGIASLEALGTVLVIPEQFISPDGIASLEAIGALILAKQAVMLLSIYWPSRDISVMWHDRDIKVVFRNEQ